MTTQFPPTENNLKTLYEQDYYLWLKTTATLLQEGQLNKIDFEDLIEELEGMSRREKDALFSNLQVKSLNVLIVGALASENIVNGSKGHSEIVPVCSLTLMKFLLNAIRMRGN